MFSILIPLASTLVLLQSATSPTGKTNAPIQREYAAKGVVTFGAGKEVGRRLIGFTDESLDGNVHTFQLKGMRFAFSKLYAKAQGADEIPYELDGEWTCGRAEAGTVNATLTLMYSTFVYTQLDRLERRTVTVKAARLLRPGSTLSCRIEPIEFPGGDFVFELQLQDVGKEQ
jgi:hypothetical protein